MYATALRLAVWPRTGGAVGLGLLAGMALQLQQATLYPLEQGLAKASISLCLHPKWQALLPALNQFILQQQQSGAVQQAVLRYLH